MPTGTLANLAQSGFVRTPPAWAERIVHNLLRFGRSACVLDPTAGEGDLLAPCATFPGLYLFGIEISQERAAVAHERLPNATLVTTAFEAVRITPASMDLILANPPYFFADGRRAEYRILADAGVALRPGGIMVAILPVRSAWDGTMINHWCKHYEQIRCWKFPDGPEDDEGAFQRYTQIVVVGVRRATPLKAPETLEQQRLAGWRWRQPKKAESPWAQGSPPPDLPELPIADPYLVPDAGSTLPELTVLNADETTLLEALARSGVQRSPEWSGATTWEADQQADQPVMPPTGEAHLAAEILTGLLDGEVLTGPHGDQYVFVTCVTQRWVRIALDPEELERERQKGVTSVQVDQQEDHPILGALNLTSGEVQYYQGEAVFAYLAPWLARLATRVLEKRQPLYRLDPADWELEVCARIGTDKQLPGAAHPGLVPPQLHRVFALGATLDTRGLGAIQGEPGTGKTRQSVALMARQAALWRQRGTVPLTAAHHPTWIKRLRLAWQTQPRAQALLGPTRTEPPALPVLVATPKRVIPTWQHEITAAWPEAEVVLVERYQDIDHWMRRCVESHAPAVVGLVSHSQSRAFGRMWQPAVLERQVARRVPELEPSEEQLLELDPIYDRGTLVGYRSNATGEVLTKVQQITLFFCPDCGRLVEASPWGHRLDQKQGKTLAEDQESEARPSEGEDDLVEPVTSRTWFEQKPRWCRHCNGALWTEARVPAAARKYPSVPFATWAEGAEQAPPQGKPWSLATPMQVRPGGKLGKAERTPRARIPATACRVTDADGTHGAAAPESFSPYEYLHRFYRGCVALTVMDESHNARSRATDIAHSIHLAQLASQTYVYASGTHYGGTLDDLFYYWLRFHPRFWRRLGLGWNDVTEAIKRYGVIQQWTREHEDTARRGSGRSDVTVTTVPAPGISARLLPRLLDVLVFLSVLDVGAHMPPRLETPEIVSMRDPALEAALTPARTALQEAEEVLRAARAHVLALRAPGSLANPEEVTRALEDQQGAEERQSEAKATLEEVEAWVQERDLAGGHDTIVSHLRTLATQGNTAAALAQGTIPRWWAALPCVEPTFTVEQTLRDKWGDPLKKEVLLTAPILTAEYLYPLEVRLGEIVTQRLETQQVVMVYYEQNGLRSMAERLAWVLKEHRPWTLPNSVEAEDREDAIRTAIRDGGHRVVLVPYRRIMEGLNLQDVVDVIVWYEMALNLFYLDQASRRHWRLGRKEAAEIVYLAYAGSAAHRKLCKLASESGAAAAFAGEPAKGALVEHVGAHKTMLARLSSSLEALTEAEEDAPLADQETLQAAFAQRATELAETLKRGRAWLGLVDTLPERLAAFHAAQGDTAAPRQARPSVVEVVEAASMAIALPKGVLEVAALQPHPLLHAESSERGMADGIEAGTILATDVIMEAVQAPLFSEISCATPSSRKSILLPTLWEDVSDGATSTRANDADTSEHVSLMPRTAQPQGHQDIGLSGASAPQSAVYPTRVTHRPASHDATSKHLGVQPPAWQAQAVQGTVTMRGQSLVVQFPGKGPHLESIRQLCRTYGGGFEWTIRAWVFPLAITKEPQHMVDAVLEAFPHLAGAAEAQSGAREMLLTRLRTLYKDVHNGRAPNEEALHQEVQTCSAAQYWIRELHRRLIVKQQPSERHT
jgi:SAM-dependent methyltransferase